MYSGEGTKTSRFVAEQRNRDEARRRDGKLPWGAINRAADEKLQGGPGKLPKPCPECHLTHPANVGC